MAELSLAFVWKQHGQQEQQRYCQFVFLSVCSFLKPQNALEIPVDELLLKVVDGSISFVG